MYPLHAWPVTDVIAIAVFLAAISYRLFVVRKTFPYLTVGWLWFFGTLVPVIGIVQSGPQGMADRFNYIPSIGLFIMVCWGIDGLWRVRFTGLEWGLWPVGVAVLALCCAATCKQIQYWRDTGTLTRHAIDLDPNNFIARTAYGVFLYERQSYPAAIAELQRAIEIVPQFPNSHAFLGRVLYHTGQPDAAAVELRTAIRLNPAEVEAHTDLGSILLDQKMAAGAEQEFVTGLKYEPDNAGIHSLLGKALAQEGRSEEARQQFLTAHNLDPAYSLPLAE
jgi:Tfp pilus assembly protein PilF